MLRIRLIAWLWLLSCSGGFIVAQDDAKGIIISDGRTRIFMDRSLDLSFTHSFEQGYPTTASVHKLYDEIDFQRACQAYLWGLPLVGFSQWQREHEEIFEAKSGELVWYTSYDDKLGLITANATTPYILGFADLRETGPLVVEIPKLGIEGGFLDRWQRPVPLTPKQLEVGRYLVVGPGQATPIQSQLSIVRTSTNNIFIGFRVLETDKVNIEQAIQKLKIFRYSEKVESAPARVLSPAGKRWSGTHPRGMAYWELLAEAIEEEPVAERDRFFTAMLLPLGIEKGKPFQPDDRQKKLLEEAAIVGEAMAKANSFDKRTGIPYWTESHWKLAMVTRPSQRMLHYDQLDERAAWFYEAVTASDSMATKKVGIGSTYLASYRDQNSSWLRGGKVYRLRVPAHVPAQNFWSVTAYDVDTRCFIENPEKIADRSSRMELTKNEDGSIDIYFAPHPPPGFEKNWIPTVPQRSWFAYFRLFGPTQTYFDRSWRLPDIELVSGSDEEPLDAKSLSDQAPN